MLPLLQIVAVVVLIPLMGIVFSPTRKDFLSVEGPAVIRLSLKNLCRQAGLDPDG